MTRIQLGEWQDYNPKMWNKNSTNNWEYNSRMKNDSFQRLYE